MRNQTVHRFTLGFALCVTASLIAPAFAANVPPDISGVWVLAGATIDVRDPVITGMAGRFGESRAGNPTGENAWQVPGPKVKGEYAERQEATRKMAALGKSVDDPTALCIPQGMPRFWFGPYAWEILQGARQIHMFQEWNDQTRRIYMDGRKHPNLDDADPSYNGHSIGHWEGDVLVIDTVNVTPETAVWGGGSRGHSEEMHIVERIRLIDADTLEVKVTVDDPKAFVEPWNLKRVLRRKPDIEIIEYNCTVNNRHTVDAEGAVQTILKPQ